MAITGHQFLDQTAERRLFRDHNRLLAPPHETLDETHKYYFHLNHREQCETYHYSKPENKSVATHTIVRHLRSSQPEDAEVSYHAIQNLYSNDLVPKAAGVKRIHQILSKANPTPYLTPGSYPLGLKAAGANVILACGGNAMAANKRTS